MRLEDMKKEIPDTPEFIHEMIQNEVEKQLQATKEIRLRKNEVKKWTGRRVAAAAIGLLAASTSVFAGVKYYHMSLGKYGRYGAITEIKSENSHGKIEVPQKIHDIHITTGYIPDGMEWVDDIHLEYPEHGRKGGFSFNSVLLDGNDLGKVMQDNNVVACEERTFGKYEGVYLRYDDLEEDGSFNQRIYLLCPDVYRVIIVYIGDDISKENAVKVVDNLKIIPKDTLLETDSMCTWSELVSPEEAASEIILTSVEERKLPVHKIGESFEISASGEDNQGKYVENNNISVCVDDVQVSDDLQLLDKKYVPEEWAGEVGADGKIVNNVLSYVKSGDGVNTVDKVVKTENVKQKLVYVTATYTNESEKDMNRMLYIGTLMMMKHKDGMYRIYNPADQSGRDYDRIQWDGAADTGEMTYFNVSEHNGNGKNYISSLKSGESVKVNMAWIVNENDLEHMYLNLNGGGATLEFSDEVIKNGLVDLCQ